MWFLLRGHVCCQNSFPISKGLVLRKFSSARGKKLGQERGGLLYWSSGLLPNPSMSQIFSYLRTFAQSISSTWKAQPLSQAKCYSSFEFQLNYHFTDCLPTAHQLDKVLLLFVLGTSCTTSLQNYPHIYLRSHLILVQISALNEWLDRKFNSLFSELPHQWGRQSRHSLIQT